MPSGPGALSLRESRCRHMASTSGGSTPSKDQGGHFWDKKASASGGTSSRLEKVRDQDVPRLSPISAMSVRRLPSALVIAATKFVGPEAFHRRDNREAAEILPLLGLGAADSLRMVFCRLQALRDLNSSAKAPGSTRETIHELTQIRDEKTVEA